MCNLDAMPARCGQKDAKGVALIDMLVGLALGAMVITAALGALSMSTQASGSVGDLSLLHTQGAFAMRVIGQHLRQAGALEPVRDAPGGPYVFDNRFVGFAGGPSAVSGSDGAGTAPDTLSVSHQNAPASASLRLDCLSEVVRTGERIDSTFFVLGAELRCRTSAKNQALIGHVADLQVMYRVRTGNAARETRRLSATELTAQLLWPGVHAVEVCLELTGESPAASGGGPDVYRNCHGANVARGGRQRLVLRHVFDLRTRTAS